MGRNRLTTPGAGVRDQTALEIALAAYQRVRAYDSDTLSSNERTILTLGLEVLHLQAEFRTLRRAATAKTTPYAPGVPGTERRKD